MDFTATSKLLHRWKSLSGYRDRPSPSIRPVVRRHYERLGKERVGRGQGMCGDGKRMCGDGHSCPSRPSAGRLDLVSTTPVHSADNLLRLTLALEGALMPRGITPRQPARTGRHEGIRKAAPREKPGVLRTPRTGKSARPHTGPAAPQEVSQQEYLQSHGTRPGPGNSAAAQHPLSRRHLRLAPPQRMGAAGRDHSLRPIHRRSREHGHA